MYVYASATSQPFFQLLSSFTHSKGLQPLRSHAKSLPFTLHVLVFATVPEIVAQSMHALIPQRFFRLKTHCASDGVGQMRVSISQPSIAL